MLGERASVFPVCCKNKPPRKWGQGGEVWPAICSLLQNVSKPGCGTLKQHSVQDKEEPEPRDAWALLLVSQMTCQVPWPPGSQVPLL